MLEFQIKYNKSHKFCPWTCKALHCPDLFDFQLEQLSSFFIWKRVNTPNKMSIGRALEIVNKTTISMLGQLAQLLCNKGSSSRGASPSGETS